MSLKLTESRVESLIDTLNALICEEQLLTREQRENMVRTWRQWVAWWKKLV